MNQTHHAIGYVEINVSDLAAARAFYEAAFGWEFNDYGGGYAGIRSPDGTGEVGGLNPARQPGPGGPLVLLYSDDLDATVAAVEQAGGQTAERPYDYPGGRRFHCLSGVPAESGAQRVISWGGFKDPSGNELGVYAHA